jgi:hypothetical protein
MMREPNKRPRRNPLTSEEVSHIIAFKKRKELIALRKLKKSSYFKIHNIFNIACMFIYLEVLFCYFGPCHYEKHYSVNALVHYGSRVSPEKNLLISDIELIEVGGKIYKCIIDDFINPPGRNITFVIGKDFLLQKELKGFLPDSNTAYRLFSANPILLLCGLVSFISFFGFIMNLNENAYTLGGLSALNVLTLIAVIAL